VEIRKIIFSALAIGAVGWIFIAEKNNNPLAERMDAADAAITQEIQEATTEQQEKLESERPQGKQEVAESSDQTNQAPEQELAPLRMNEDINDVEAKRAAAKKLVERAKKYFDEHSLEDACSTFAHTKEFVEGELYIFVFDKKGVVFANPDEELVWSNLLLIKDEFGVPVAKPILDTAKAGGGWATYQWRNSTKRSWVQPVSKDGKDYVIGAGYYPHSKEDTVVSLVKAAVVLFNRVKSEGKQPAIAFSDMSYPLGNFVFADLYLYVLDEKATLMAQGDRPNLIGTNAWDYKDAEGKLVNQEIINRAKETKQGIWVDYISKRAKKHTYVEKVEDAEGNFYFIACGYYPEENRQVTVDLVRKGYTFMKRSGKSAAAEEFTDRTNDEYRYGDIYLVVYDMKGKCIANGGNSELVGRDMWDARDEDGRYYLREIIEEAKTVGSGWSTFKRNKSYMSVYFEKIELGIDTFVIGAGLYPVSKKDTVDLMTKTAAGFFNAQSRKDALAAFVRKDGPFVNGDLEIFVFDVTGICYAYGTDYDLIWRKMLDIKDDDGKPFVKLFINAVERGDAEVSFKLNKHIKVAELVPVEKGNIKYVIGSSYFIN